MPQQQQQQQLLLEGNSNSNNNNNMMRPGSSGTWCCSVRETQNAVAKFLKLLQMRHQHHRIQLRNAKGPKVTTSTKTTEKKTSMDGSREVCSAYMMLALEHGAATPHDIQTTSDKVALMLGGTDDARVEGLRLFFLSCLNHAIFHNQNQNQNQLLHHPHHQNINTTTHPRHLRHPSLCPPLQARSTTTNTTTTTPATTVITFSMGEETRKESDFFVAVHVGAGFHSPTNADAYSSAMSDACMAAATVLNKGGGTALDAVEAAIRVLEDSWVTNAGLGSNLTENGCVESDASVMDGYTRSFGAVGAVPGVKNAVSVAARLAKESQLGLLPLGRIRPIFLVGDGARDWALSRGLDLMPPNKKAPHGLVTEKAHRQWMRYSEMVAKASASNSGNHSSSLGPAAAPPPPPETHPLPRGTECRGAWSMCGISPGQATRGGVVTAVALQDDINNNINNNKKTAMTTTMASTGLSHCGMQDHPLPHQHQHQHHEQHQREGEEEEEEVGAAPWDHRQHSDGTIIVHTTAATDAKGPRRGATPPAPPTTATTSVEEGAKEKEEEDEEDNAEVRLDTVGAVCVDTLGHVASGVSSGGIAMKVRGRVGEAAVYGCGCWAANADCCDDDDGDGDGDGDAGQQPAVASSATGVGESIIRGMLARHCCHAARTAEDGPGPACERVVSGLVKRMREAEYATAAADAPSQGLLPPSEAGILLLTAHSSSSSTNNNNNNDKRTTTSSRPFFAPPNENVPPPPPPPPPPRLASQQQQQQQQQQGFAGLLLAKDGAIPSATTAAAGTPRPPPQLLGAATSPSSSSSSVGPHGESSSSPLLVPGGLSSSLEEHQEHHHHQQQQQQQSCGPIMLMKAQSQYDHARPNNNNNHNNKDKDKGNNKDKEKDGSWARRGGQEGAAAACAKEEQHQRLEMVELVAVHSAPSFGVGYMASTMAHPHTVILRSQDHLQGKAAVNTFAVLRRF